MKRHVTMVAAQNIGEPKTMQEAMNSPDHACWKEAINSEYESFMRNKTWKLMPLPPGRKTVSNIWLFKQKLNLDQQLGLRQGWPFEDSHRRRDWTTSKLDLLW